MNKQEQLLKYAAWGLDKIKAGEMEADKAFTLLTWLEIAESLHEDSETFALVMSWFENEMLETTE